MYTDITFKVIGSTVVFTTTTKIIFHLIAVLSFNHFYSGRYHLSLLLWSVPHHFYSGGSYHFSLLGLVKFTSMRHTGWRVFGGKNFKVGGWARLKFAPETILLLYSLGMPSTAYFLVSTDYSPWTVIPSVIPRWGKEWLHRTLECAPASICGTGGARGRSYPSADDRGRPLEPP